MFRIVNINVLYLQHINNLIMKKSNVRIRDARHKLHLTQLQLAKKVGLSRNVIARIEGGTEGVSYKVVDKVHEFFKEKLEKYFYG